MDLTWEATAQALRAQAEVEKSGIHLAGRPDDESPELPDDPTLLDDGELMTLFGRYMAWADFSATQLAFAEVDLRMYEQMVSEKKALLMLQKRPSAEALRKGEEKMTLINAAITGDPEMLELQQHEATAYARRKLLLTAYERYDRDATYLSRELTRRTEGSDPKQRRSSRWNT